MCQKCVRMDCVACHANRQTGDDALALLRPASRCQAADPDKRTVAVAYTADLEAGLSSKASLRQLRHEFVTQEQAYDLGDGSEQAAVAGQAAAADADGTAVTGVEPDLVQAEQAAEQQLKKQRIS